MKISDSTARAAALQADQSFIVQAPAGSGKTGLLVYRMLRLLAEVESPQQVLAITFTKKATSEMLERLLELLRKAEYAQHSDDLFEQQGIDLAEVVMQQDRARGWNLLDSPHQIQIFTIDAFCARLTASMPWLSQLGDRPRTTDNAQGHYAVAVEQLLSELLNPQSELAESIRIVMLELDFNYNKARRLFASMLAKRDQWLRHLLQNDLAALQPHLEQAWQSVVNQQLGLLATLVTDNQLRRMIDLARQAAQKVEVKAGVVSQLSAFEDFDRSARFLAAEQWSALRHLFLTGSKGDGKFRASQASKALGIHSNSPEREVFVAILEELNGNEELRVGLLETDFLPNLRFSDVDWRQLTALEHVLKSLAAFLQLRFRATGECDHSEVTQRANLALQEMNNPTDLGLRLDSQLQHLLVDEFQDTSHAHIELLKRLTAGWDEKLDNPTKTLFLVGDPMQSIYRFREADVSLFLQVAQNKSTGIFPNISISTLTLSENFRSSASLVNWFNGCFKSSFPEQNNVLAGAICYANASSNKAENSNYIQLSLAHDKTQQASMLVNAVQTSLQALPSAQSQVAILVRTRAQLKELLPALDEANIAYQGIEIKPLKDLQAVVDLLALVRAICRDDDRLAWMALLRGPWCGLSLEEIAQLAANHDQTLWQQMTKVDVALLDLNAEGAVRLRRFIMVMGDTLEQRQQVELSSLARWSWEKLGGEYTLYGADSLDLDSVFQLIRQLEVGGDLPAVSELDKALDGLYARPAINSGEVTNVTVSTIHRAKGLQYHTVILPSLSSPPKASNKEMLMWAEQQSNSGKSLLLLAPLRSEDNETGTHYGFLRHLDLQRARNEAIRLMYVACTRAEQRLVLLGVAKWDDENGEAIIRKDNSLMSTVWQATQSQFNFTHAADSTPTPEVSYSQTLSRLPGDFARHAESDIDWQVQRQLYLQNVDQEKDQSKGLEYLWATEVATAVGIILHDWLQFAGAKAIDAAPGQTRRQRWRAELLALKVAEDRVEYAIKRLSTAVRNIQEDSDAHFLFIDRAIQHNEYTLSAYEQEHVARYRIDRTFVDENNVRWIVDYKSTFTRNEDVDAFVDEQIASRHFAQLQKYAELMSQIDDREIRLAVYFPMLKKLRTWKHQADQTHL